MAVAGGELLHGGGVARCSTTAPAVCCGLATLTYDGNGNPATATDPLGRTVTTVYDAAGRLTSRTDRLGRRRDFSYDDANRLTGETWLNAAGGTDQLQTYTYDAASNRLTAQDPDGAYTYTHDAEGNRTKKSKGTNDETWTYGYDHRNQLTWIEKRATDGGTLELRLEFKYDTFNRRIAESRWTAATGTVVTRFGFDRDNVWADLDSSDALVMRYVRPDGMDALAARVSGAGVVGWHYVDRQGSVRLNVSAAGAVLNRVSYDGFGRPVSETNPSAADAYQYTGKAYQGDSGTQENWFRIYDAWTGRWLTVDPWHFAAGDYNLYRYVGNSPTNATDPMRPRGVRSTAVRLYRRGRRIMLPPFAVRLLTQEAIEGFGATPLLAAATGVKRSPNYF